MTRQRKTVMVTGGTRGLGRGVALKLAQQGFRLVINYHRDEKTAQETLDLLRQQGAEALALQADVRDWDSVQQLFDKATRHFGSIDILINNVGDFLQKSFDELSVEEWRALLDSNLNSCFYCCKTVLPGMRRQKYGRIINIGLANAGVKAYRQVLPYAIAKTGVHILTKSLAAQEAEHGITVNVLAPGLMDNGSLTEQQVDDLANKVPLRRLGNSGDLAGVVLYLISDEANYVTGAEIPVSGGWGL